MVLQILEGALLSNLIAFGSLLVAVVTIAISIRTNTRNSRKSIYFSSTIQSLFTYADTGEMKKRLIVKFDDKPVEDLLIADLAIWNGGMNVIKSDDFATDFPLSISVPQGQLLSIETIYTDKPGANFLITKDAKSGSMDFQFINPGKGLIIKVLFTSKNKEIEIGGSLMSGTIESEFGGLEDDLRAKKRKKIALAISFTTLGFLMAYTLLGGHAVPAWFTSEMEFFVTLLAFVFFPLFLYSFFPGHPRHKIPKHLKQHIPVVPILETFVP